MLQSIFIFVFPLLVLFVIERKPKLGILSPIIICYIVGIILANIPAININQSLSLTLAETAVPIAIPLILFSTDFIKWIHLAKKTIISFVLVIISAVVSAIIIALLMPKVFDEYWKVSGMLVGVYTGGTPNLMAIGLGLKVKEETLLLVNASDVILGGLYFLSLILLSKRLLCKFLPSYEQVYHKAIGDDQSIHTDKMKKSAIFDLSNLKTLIVSVLLSLIFVGVSAGISMLLLKRISEIAVMLMLTTFGIAASFNKKIRNMKGTYEYGQYFLLVFSLAIGTTVNIKSMTSTSPHIFIYTALVMTVAIIIHYIVSAFFRIDTDTVIITSTAGIFGPAFVGPVADAIKNKEIVISGFTCGLVGYAVGNYFGFMTAYLLKAIIGL